MRIDVMLDTNILKFLMGGIKHELSNLMFEGASVIEADYLERIQSSSLPNGFKQKYIDSVNVFSDLNNDGLPIITIEGGGNIQSIIIEKGMKSFDMKKGLLSGKKVKTSPTGVKYVTVPFEQKTPSAMSKQMPKEVYSQAKKLGYGKSLKDMTVKGFGKLSKIGRKSNLKNKTTHKSGKYEGLTKVGRKGHAQYFTFRRVTENSDGWIHPGFKATPVFPNVVETTQRTLKMLLQDNLKKAISPFVSRYK